MSNRINITCGNCQQKHAVDPKSAGQQVQCPKCQQLSTIPKRQSTSQPQVTPAKNAAVAKVTVMCPNCGTRLLAKALTKPAIANCPNCKTGVQIPAAENGRSSTSSMQSESARGKPKTPPVGHSTGSTTSNPSIDLGQIDVGSIGDPIGPAPIRRRPIKGTAVSFASGFLGWINNHRWVTLIILLNLLPLIVAIIFPPILVLCIINVPVGLAIIGLLFIPRQHIIKRVTDKFGAQLASVGAGGVALIVVAVGVKAIPRLAGRAGNNPNLDFSNLGAVIGVLFTLLIVFVILLVLWRLMGIARALAAGYCLQLSIMTFLLGLAAASQENRFDFNSGRDSTIAATAESRRDARSEFERVEQRSREGRERALARHREQIREFQQRNASQPSSNDSAAVPLSSENTDSRHNPTGPPIGIDPNLPPDSAMAARIEAFRERNSREHTVVIKIARASENDSAGDVRLALQRTLGFERHFFSMFGDQALLLFVHEGPVSQIVEKLTIGKVLNVDEADRTIEIRIDSLES